MKITLIIFLLSVQSSYSDNREESVDGFADTIQWVVGEDEIWRIKTFAIDEDVHPYRLDRANWTDEEWIALARRNVEKHYGDVFVGEVIVQSRNGLADLRGKLKQKGLGEHLNVGKDGLVFWSPEGTDYRTRSTPQQ